MFKKHLRCLYVAIEKSVIYDGVEHAGYMSFMVILSLFPFLVFFLALTSFFGASEIGQNLVDFIIESSPDTLVESLKIRLEELKKAPPTSLINLAIFGTIWTASSFVEGLRTILNRMFEVTSPPPYITRRLLSILQFLILCIILAFVIMIFVVIPAFLQKFNFTSFLINYTEMIGKFRQFYLHFLIFICVLGFYRFIPNTEIRTLNMIPGAILTTICWVASGHLLSKYIVYYHQLSLVYGSVGSIIVTLIFFYKINFIFIVGAAYNYQLTIYDARSQN